MATHRTSIAKKMAELLNQELAEPKVTAGIYYTNLYNNASTQILHFDQVKDFPFISVVKGTEYTEYQGGGFRWQFLEIYMRVFVSGYEDYDEQLEKVITDIKTFIDTNESFEYNITKPNGDTIINEVTEITWESVTTDEGLLAPDAFGEIKLRVRYEDMNALNCM
ncbi:tail terminator [Vibrio phage D239]